MKPLSGSLFVEEEKKNPSHADWRGSLKINADEEYWADGYNVVGKSGPSVSIELRKKNVKFVQRSKNDKTDLGVLELNTAKTDPKHADRKGRINVGGKDYWLSAWDNTAQTSGKRYMSLKLNEIVPKAASPEKEAAWSQPKTDDSSFGSVDIGVPLDFDDAPPF